MIGKPEQLSQYLWKLDKDKLYEIVEHKQKRSLDSNAYLWVLLQKIAEKIHNTKEETYREFIKDYGQFEILPLREDTVETFINAWTKKGLGWICEEIGDSKFRGYKNVIAYYGTSCYTSDKFSKLLDAVIEEAKEMGIETLTEEEIRRMK